MQNTRLLLLTCCMLLLAITGCAPFATYPPVEGSLAINNPTYEPVPSIMADAIRYVHARYGQTHEHDFAFNLPAGAPVRAYEQIIHKLGEGRPQVDPNDWTYHIVSIRSRGLNAEADVIVPSDDANTPPFMVTLHMRKKLTNYAIESMKHWNYAVDLPSPNYTPEQEEDAAFASESGSH